MSKKFSSVLVLCMSSMCLCGCYLLRVSGPCYGVGCPLGAPGQSGQYKPGQGLKAQSAQAQTAPTRNAPVQNAPVSTSANAVAAPTSTAQSPSAASAQPAAAQIPSADQKSSPMHSIGEFFTHLLPHHNSSNGANSGAAN